MPKIDFTKKYKAHYTAKAQPELITTEPVTYLSLTGQGDPSSDAFAARLQALYSVAYAIKFMYKARDADFTVPKLEGLWWFDETGHPGLSAEEAPVQVPRSEWFYRMLIRMPEDITEALLLQAAARVAEKKDIPFVAETGLFYLDEGSCVQMLHTGPFDREPETLAVMQAFMDDYKFVRNGLHHEIYLSDFRKTSPSKLRTILREPVRLPGL